MYSRMDGRIFETQFIRSTQKKQSNLARGHIAFLSLYLSQWRMHSFTTCDGQAQSPCVVRLQLARICAPQKCPFPWGTWTPSVLDARESSPIQHLNWFSHICTAHPCVQHTQTTQYATSSNRPYLMHCMQAVQPNNDNYKKQQIQPYSVCQDMVHRNHGKH